MIVDSSRDALLDGDCGSMSSPLNLAFFYGGSPRSSEGSCSPSHSPPESPESDTELSGSSGQNNSSSRRPRRRGSSSESGKRRFARSSSGQGTGSSDWVVSFGGRFDSPSDRRIFPA